MTNEEGAVDEGGEMLVLSQKQAVVPPLYGERGDAVHLAVEHEGLLLYGDDVAGLQREGELGFTNHTWRRTQKGQTVILDARARAPVCTALKLQVWVKSVWWSYFRRLIPKVM